MKATETLDRLYLELSQVTSAKTAREIALEAALRRQMQSHQSIRDVLEAGATELGINRCIDQCGDFAAEAIKVLAEPTA